MTPLNTRYNKYIINIDIINILFEKSIKMKGQEVDCVIDNGDYVHVFNKLQTMILCP